eukprot:Hpha_TRINITY_DN15984_c2_g6::TRINITY_DN15984_c2_g6_i1::g.72856::m.72856/K14950/ATP13A1, SPF1; manganese-transporting P-type ATPase
MDLSHPNTLQGVQAYKPDPGRRTGLMAMLVVTYAFSINWAIQTAGDPHSLAVEEATMLDSKKIEKEARVAQKVEWVEDEDDHVASIDGDDHQERKQPRRAAPQNAGTPSPPKEEEDEDLPDDLDSDFDDVDDPGAAVRRARWKEEQQELKQKKSEDKPEKVPEKAPTDEEDEEDPMPPRPLPSQYLPSAGAVALLFSVVCLHILFHLVCHWQVWFRAKALFMPAASIQDGVYILVYPLPHHGKPELAQIHHCKHQKDRLVFIFQRQRFEYLPSQECREKGIEDAPNGFVRPITPDVTKYISKYIKAHPVRQAEVLALTEQYGENQLQVAAPSVLSMLKQQMLSPLAVFQVFTSLLWALDEYWQYTLINMVFIVILESTTCFQRSRTLQQLSKMSIRSFRVYVCRDHKWEIKETRELVPGDIISLRVSKADAADTSAGTVAAPEEAAAAAGSEQKKDKEKESKKAKATAQLAACDLVPCDCLLLRGSAILNESTLTGESVPAMKDAVARADADRALDMDVRDRIHVMFSGTTIVDSKQGVSVSGDDLPDTPDGGCLCRVLRTGFGSSQGSLMQLIEFSTQEVAGDAREMLVALFILLAFALVAAYYVFQRGMEKGDRTTHELLVKAVLIVTSVVPRQLPMQMMLAVNHALMSLMKAGVMCTEPYRVPLAGKITHCLFDKTGTLTTDTLVPAGVVNPGGKGSEMVKVREASLEAAIVLAGCHSLLHVDGEGIVGDPIELAALRGVEWRYDAAKQIARPGDWEVKEQTVKRLELELKALDKNPKRKKEVEKQLEEVKKAVKEDQEKSKKDKTSVHILHRHHFSSKLQRMSVVAEIENGPGGKRGLCALVKGSPEQLATLFDPKNPPPAWYEKSYTSLMEEGSRVLALGYKWWDGGDPKDTARSKVESNLRFAGFIAFSCRVRADTPDVVKALAEAQHEVIMVTGDGPLTALHVAKQVGICPPKSQTLTLEQGEGGELYWVNAIKSLGPLKIPLSLRGEGSIEWARSRDHSVMMTEAMLEAALDHAEVGEALWPQVGLVQVFARCSPQGKGKIIRQLQEVGKELGTHVLMCGDGGNDVGALKQADVGIALLCGYGNANTGDAKKEDAKPGAAAAAEDGMTAEERLNKRQQEMQKKGAETQTLRKELMGKKQKDIMANQQQWLQEEMLKLDPSGNGGFMVQMQAMKNVYARVQQEMQKEGKEVGKVGGVYTPDIGDMIAQAETETMLIRPGDASVAASFTTRQPSIRAAVDLIRQGRCTLLSALQQQQIMMLESLIQAFSLSMLALEGARSSERQLLASGWLISTASLAFSYATPVEKMHHLRPLRSLFHPSVFVSMAGQAVIHIGCMYYAHKLASELMGEKELRSVLAFHRRVRAGEEMEQDEDDPLAAITALWAMPFKPNLLNTVIFLVETAQIMSILFVNYKGRPWMKGVMENHFLFLSLFLCFGGIVFLAWGYSPTINTMMHLVPFPDDEFRWQVVSLVLMSFFGTFVWDRLCVFMFAPKIGGAMLDEARRTKPADLLPVFLTFCKVFGGLAIFSTGNLLLYGLVFFAYRKYKAAQNKDA